MIDLRALKGNIWIERLLSLHNILDKISEDDIEHAANEIHTFGFDKYPVLRSLVRCLYKFSLCRPNMAKTFLYLIENLQTKSDIVSEMKNQTTFAQNIRSPLFQLFNEKYKLNHMNISGWKRKSSKIARIIREDDLESLKSLSTDPKFNFNAKIKADESVYHIFQVNSCSLIEYTAFSSSIKCFKFLLLNGSNYVSNKSRLGLKEISCMSYALAGGNEDIINILTQSGQKADAFDLYYVVSSHQPLVYEWIVDQFGTGNDILEHCLRNEFFYPVHALGEASGSVLLQIAAHREITELILFLLEHSNIDIRRILESSCVHGMIEVVEQIIQKQGSDFHNICYQALMNSIENGKTNILNIILRAEGVNCDLRGEKGALLLMKAIKCENKEMVEILCNIDEIDETIRVNGNSALSEAEKLPNKEILDFLLHSNLDL